MLIGVTVHMRTVCFPSYDRERNNVDHDANILKRGIAAGPNNLHGALLNQDREDLGANGKLSLLASSNGREPPRRDRNAPPFIKARLLRIFIQICHNKTIPFCFSTPIFVRWQAKSYG